MRILISNDDGINAPGIIALAKAAMEFGEVHIVAPDRERSAASHSLTLTHPLRVNEEKFPIPVKQAFSVNGTPADCVKIAFSNVLKFKPDLVLSGINRGPNLSIDVFYSGTVAAAFEGVIAGCPAIAFSLADYDRNCDYSTAALWVKTCLKAFQTTEYIDGIIYNVNIPPIPAHEIKGARITRLGKLTYNETYEKRDDPGGRPYYWLKGIPEILDGSNDCDIVAIEAGYVSINPIRAELTDFDAMKNLSASDFVNKLRTQEFELRK